MTLKMIKTAVAVLGILLLAAQAMAAEAPAFKTQKEKVSYGIGVDVAKNFQRLGLDVDTEVLITGLRDVLSGGKLKMSEDDLRTTMNAYNEELKQKMIQSRQAAAEKNMKEGEAFLAENKKKEGVVVLPSGLQYKILKAGDGKKPTDADTVECHYRGAFINGTEFESSYRAGKTVTFKVTGVIPGWSEALKLMPVGSKWQLFIPSRLAYGEQGAGNRLGPNAALIFDVELVAIK